MSKYGNKKTEVDGILFDSKKEAARYQDLKLLERAKQIGSLTMQPKFVIEINKTKVCTYIADFAYHDLVKGWFVVEDVKGMRTPIYRLKKKLMKACHGIEITEI